MRRRPVMLVIALAIAALGAGLILTYVKGVDARATADQELVGVLTATETIPAGETLGQAQAAGKVERRQVRRADLVTGALTDTDGLDKRAALAPIYAGQQLLPQMFGTPEDKTAGLALQPGQAAVSVRLKDPDRVARFVEPGSHVAVFGTTDAAREGRVPSRTSVVVADALVLAVGTTATPAKTGSVPAEVTNDDEVVFTLALNQEQAEKTIVVSRTATASFAVLGKGTSFTRNPSTDLIDAIPLAGAR